MAIIFSHDTALEILRAIPPQAKLTKPFAGEVPMGGDGITTDFGELARVDPAAFGARSRPVHVLVGKGQRRSQAREVVSHEFGEGRVPFPLLWGFSQTSGSSRHGIYFVVRRRSLSSFPGLPISCRRSAWALSYVGRTRISRPRSRDSTNGLRSRPATGSSWGSSGSAAVAAWGAAKKR